jgi:hypothetical protein
VDIGKSALYLEYLALKEEVLKHKWYESEKCGYDIGFTRAMIDWTLKFKSKWLKERKAKKKS